MRTSIIALAIASLLPLSGMAQPMMGHSSQHNACMNDGAACNSINMQGKHRSDWHNKGQARYQNHRQTMFNSLNLTPEQEAAFNKEMQANRAQHQHIRSQYTHPMTEQQRQKMRAEHMQQSTAAHQRMREVLNAEQKVEFDKITSQRRIDNMQRMQDRQNYRSTHYGQGHRGNHRMNSQHPHFSNLNLTPEQQAAFDKEIQSSVEKHQAVRDKYIPKLSQEQRQSMLDEKQKIRTETQEKLRAILTIEQQAEFDKLQTQMNRQANSASTTSAK
ncbi:Spy/CpxP family protein refolding chaperone [Pseudomonas sp. F1_0610]|uniref:Spy/CpxP family protein refolding chaperone n=1 Tax=Pseudomonas sp. F1_0610 TaxID=3114284 RepID=UPI0039C1FD4B